MPEPPPAAPPPLLPQAASAAARPMTPAPSRDRRRVRNPLMESSPPRNARHRHAPEAAPSGDRAPALLRDPDVSLVRKPSHKHSIPSSRLPGFYVHNALRMRIPMRSAPASMRHDA